MRREGQEEEEAPLSSLWVPLDDAVTSCTKVSRRWGRNNNDKRPGRKKKGGRNQSGRTGDARVIARRRNWTPVRIFTRSTKGVLSRRPRGERVHRRVMPERLTAEQAGIIKRPFELVVASILLNARPDRRSTYLATPRAKEDKCSRTLPIDRPGKIAAGKPVDRRPRALFFFSVIASPDGLSLSRYEKVDGTLRFLRLHLCGNHTGSIMKFTLYEVTKNDTWNPIFFHTSVSPLHLTDTNAISQEIQRSRNISAIRSLTLKKCHLPIRADLMAHCVTPISPARSLNPSLRGYYVVFIKGGTLSRRLVRRRYIKARGARQTALKDSARRV